MPGDVASPWAGAAALPLSDDTAFLKLIDEANDTTLNLAVGDLTVMPIAKPPEGHYIAGGYMFGRRSNANGLLPFTSRVLSRSHIQLLIDTEGAVWAVDLKSLHGTAIERKSGIQRDRTITLKPNVPMRIEHDDVLIFGKPVSASDGVQHLPLRVLVNYYHEPAKVDYPAAPSFADSPASIKMPGYLHRGYGIPVMYESEQEDADSDARDGDSVVCLGDSPSQRAKASIEIIDVRDSPATEPEPSRHNTPKNNTNVSQLRFEVPRQLHFEVSRQLDFEAPLGEIDFELPALPDNNAFDLPSPPANMFVDDEAEEDDDVDLEDEEEEPVRVVGMHHDYSSSDDEDVSSENSFVDSEHDSSEHGESDDEAISADESDRHSESSVDEDERFWRTEHLFSFSHPSVVSLAPREPEIEEEAAAFVKSSVPEENDDEVELVEPSHEPAMPGDNNDGQHSYVFEANSEADASKGEAHDGGPYLDMGSPMSAYNSPRTPSQFPCSPAYSASLGSLRSRSVSPVASARSASPAFSAARSASPALSDAERARTRSPDAPYIPGWAINRAANARAAPKPPSEQNEARAADMQNHIDHFFNTIAFDHENESPMPSAIEGAAPFGCSLPPSPPLSSGGDGVDRETRTSEFKSMSTAPPTPPSPARKVSLPSRVAQVVVDKVMDKEADKMAVDKGVATLVPIVTDTPSRKRKRDDADGADETEAARPAQAPRTLSFLKGIAVGVGLGASLTFGALYQLGAE